MPRRKWLPANVTTYRDRHGKTRYRYRKTGKPSHEFKHAPGTSEFMAEYEDARNAIPESERGLIPYSYDALIASFYRSAGWARMQPNSQHTYRGILERFRVKNGHKDCRAVGTGTLDELIAKKAATPAAANNLRKTLKRLHKHAVKQGWRKDNPVTETDGFPSGKGWHTWSDDEIARYRAKWPYGTIARLTLELGLNTAARRCNLAVLERAHLIDGRWQIDHVKDNDSTFPTLTAETREAIETLPAAPIRFFITGQHGKPYTAESLSNRFRKWAREAGCPTNIHGLRKGVSRQLAERGATVSEGRAMTGHTNDRTFLHYAAKADRRRLADSAQAKMIGEPDLANPGNTNE